MSALWPMLCVYEIPAPNLLLLVTAINDYAPIMSSLGTIVAALETCYKAPNLGFRYLKSGINSGIEYSMYKP